jgi:hypothetical protein
MKYNNEYICKLISNFIPIIIIYLLIVYPNWFIYYGNTVLGKIASLIIIIYYTLLDLWQGLFVCAIVILFYQMLHLNGYDNNIYLINEMFKNNESSPSPSPPSYKQDFKKEYCENGNLKYKGTLIKKDIISHIFPEINFTNEVCNPCDNTCDFNIIEEDILNRDRELKTPKSSNDWVWTAWNNLTI